MGLQRRIGLAGAWRLDPVKVDLPGPMPPPQHIPASVHEDSVEPGVESGDIAQAGKVDPGGDEGILGCIARVGLIAKDGAGRSEGSIESHFDESFEGDLVASCGAFNQVLVARQRKLSGSVAQLHVINHAPANASMTSAKWARLGQFRCRPRELAL
jgi:hypothetical protein